jgi:hypothetical protein
MGAGGRIRRAMLGLVGPVAVFGVGVVLGARVGPLLSELSRRLEF